MTADTVHARRWWILGVLILSLFAATLDNTILNVALPTLARELHATTSQLQWMVDSYVLVFAGLLLVAGALSDRHGRRLALLGGLAIFGVGSVVSAFVTTADQLILARAFMGLGAALTMPATLSIIANVFDETERPKAIAAWSAVSGLGIVVGPILGGWLVEHFAWNAIFLVNVPVVVLGIAAILAVVPESKAAAAPRLDPVGAILSVGGLVALVYGIIEVPAHGWGDPAIVVSLSAAVVLLGAFLVWERRVAEPMLDIRLFRNPRFSAASLSVTLVFFSLMGVLFFLTQYLQGVLGLTALETGIRFVPLALGIVASAPVSAVLTNRFGAKVSTAFGLLVTAGSLGLLATVNVASGDLLIGSVLAIAGFGVGVAMTPSTDAIMGALPKEQAGVGSAVNDTTREIGGAIGVAILGSVLSAVYSGRMQDVSAALPTEVGAIVRDSIGGALAVAEGVGGAAGAAITVAARAAFVDGMAAASIIGMVVAIGGAVIALVWLPARSAAVAEEIAPETEPGLGGARSVAAA
ncbi:MAG TPA: DHA2 family efflux MFS transporter permease subunit [Candidatus Limnocylindrales bacterium]|nr:DHA2 family efflux MFS transporter permease subunit [Candidatus Limnocylindrales bacterium]